MTNTILQPWQLLLAILSGVVNREQLRTIEYLRTENQVLKEKIGKKRFMLNDGRHAAVLLSGCCLTDQNQRANISQRKPQSAPADTSRPRSTLSVLSKVR